MPNLRTQEHGREREGERERGYQPSRVIQVSFSTRLPSEARRGFNSVSLILAHDEGPLLGAFLISSLGRLTAAGSLLQDTVGLLNFRVTGIPLVSKRF